jgi:hypothetical protein
MPRLVAASLAVVFLSNCGPIIAKPIALKSAELQIVISDHLVTQLLQKRCTRKGNITLYKDIDKAQSAAIERQSNVIQVILKSPFYKTLFAVMWRCPCGWSNVGAGLALADLKMGGFIRSKVAARPARPPTKAPLPPGSRPAPRPIPPPVTARPAPPRPTQPRPAARPARASKRPPPPALAAALKKLAAGQTAVALKAAEAYLKSHPSNYFALIIVSEGLLKEYRDLSRARTLAAKAKQVDGTAAAPYRLLGLLALKFRERSPAKANFEEWLKRVDGYPSEKKHKPLVKALLKRLK